MALETRLLQLKPSGTGNENAVYSWCPKSGHAQEAKFRELSSLLIVLASIAFLLLDIHLALFQSKSSRKRWIDYSTYFWLDQERGQSKGLEWGWKRRVRLGTDTPHTRLRSTLFARKYRTHRRFAPCKTNFEEKKTTLLQFKGRKDGNVRLLLRYGKIGDKNVQLVLRLCCKMGLRPNFELFTRRTKL